MSKWDILVCEFLTLRMHPQCTPKYIIYSILSQAVLFQLSFLFTWISKDTQTHYSSVIWPMLSSFSFLTFFFLIFNSYMRSQTWTLPDFCLLVFWTIVYTTYLYHPFHTKGFIIWSHKNLEHTHLQSLVRCVTFRISPTRFRFGKGIAQSCILSPFLFNLYTEYIMRNAVLNEA